MTRLAALLAVSASAAAAGGLAPPIVQPVATFSFITPQAVVERCPVVPTALDSLRAQGFTRLVAEPGSRVARVSAFRDGQWTVVGYDCRSGALLFQDAVAAAEADLVDDGIYILEGTEVDATADLAAGTRLDEIGSVATVSAEADVAAGAGADLASTSVELSNGGSDIVGNGRSGDPSAFTRIDATDAISGGEITEQGF